MVAWTASAAPASAQDGDPKAVVVGGLRPTSNRDYKGIRMEGLPEAQRLREIVEELTGEITQRPVLNHAALRAALGGGYLVDMVDCEGNSTCVTRVFRSLHDRAAFLVFGDYAVTSQSYLFRIRLIDFATGKMLAENEFSLEPDAIEDREAWKRGLTSLLAVIEIKEETTAPPDPGSGSSGGAEGTSTEGSGSGGGGIDELTDADFGAPVAEVAPRPEPQEEGGSWIDLTAGAAMGTRKFVFDTAPGMGASRPAGFSSPLSVSAGGAAAVYPMAGFRSRLASGLGIHGAYERTVTSDAAEGVRASRLSLALGYRIAVGGPNLPRFTILAGYRRENVEIDDDTAALPDLAYSALALGAAVSAPLGTPRVALGLGAHYLVVADSGAIASTDNYGSAGTAGLEIESQLELRVFGGVFIRAGAVFSRVVFDFDGNGALSGPQAIGARDRYMAGTIASGLIF